MQAVRVLRVVTSGFPVHSKRTQAQLKHCTGQAIPRSQAAQLAIDEVQMCRGLQEATALPPTVQVEFSGQPGGVGLVSASRLVHAVAPLRTATRLRGEALLGDLERVLESTLAELQVCLGPSCSLQEAGANRAAGLPLSLLPSSQDSQDSLDLESDSEIAPPAGSAQASLTFRRASSVLTMHSSKQGNLRKPRLECSSTERLVVAGATGKRAASKQLKLTRVKEEKHTCSSGSRPPIAKRKRR